jgi:CTP synthase
VESYKSLNEALIHAGIANDTRVIIRHIDSEEIEEKGADAVLGAMNAVLVAPGFGARGTEGKIAAVTYARTHDVPFFGICLGMQMAVVEFARNVCGLAGANSSEVTRDTPHPVVDLMPEQRGVTDKGATMRLGAYPCDLKEGTRARALYGEARISERHRHRWEINNEYVGTLQQHGLVLSGMSPDRSLVEMIELPDHPFFVACQFHPEFQSRPLRPHPLFRCFVEAALAHHSARLDRERGSERHGREARVASLS